MKKIIAFVVLFGALILRCPYFAQAHVVKNTGTVGVVMHIAPQDDPTAGEETTLHLTFKDTSEKLWIRECDCTLNLMQSGDVISSIQLKDDVVVETIQVSRPVIIFPEMGVYELVIAGSPLDGESFESFELRYPVRVSRKSAALKDRDTDENVENTVLSENAELQKLIVQLVISLFGVGIMLWLTTSLTSQKVSTEE